MAAAEIQVSRGRDAAASVYRSLAGQLSTAAQPPSALRDVVDAWFYTLQEGVLAGAAVDSR